MINCVSKQTPAMENCFQKKIDLLGTWWSLVTEILEVMILPKLIIVEHIGLILHRNS